MGLSSRLSGARSWALALGLIYLAGAIAWHLAHRGHFVDFKVYLEAAGKAHSGRTVYDVTTIDQFKYAPSVATLLGTLIHDASFARAAPLFACAMTGLWLIAGREVCRITESWAGFALLLFSHCLATDIVMGQINATAVALLLLGYRGLESRRSAQVGLSWGLALQIKLYAAFAFPVLLFRKDWRSLAWACACFLLCNLGWVSWIHGWTYAISELEAWVRTLSASTSDLILNRDNISLLGVVGKWILKSGSPPNWIPRAVWFLGALSFLGFGWTRRRAPTSFQLAWSMLGILVLNPLTWSYWLYFSAPALLLTLQKLGRTKKPAAYWLLSLGALQVLTFIDQATVHRGSGVGLALILAWLLLREFSVTRGLSSNFGGHGSGSAEIAPA